MLDPLLIDQPADATAPRCISCYFVEAQARTLGSSDAASGSRSTLTRAELAKKPGYMVLNAIPPCSGIGREAAEGLTAQGARVALVMLSQRAAFAVTGSPFSFTGNAFYSLQGTINQGEQQ